MTTTEDTDRRRPFCYRTKSINEHGCEFDKSNPYIGFGSNQVIDD